MKNKLPIFIYGSLVFGSFVLFSYIVHKDIFTQLDFNTTVRLQDNLSRRYDSLFSIFSLVGNFEVLSIVLVILLIVRKKIIFGISAILLYISIHFVELFGKIFVDHLPPPHFLLRTEKLVDFPQFYVRLENSYPSGHSARTAFISIILILLIGKSKKLSINQKYIIWFLVIVFDLTMFISRIYLGEHWTSDVIGGALLGFSLGLLSFTFLRHKT
ncbi:MAG TPA: phosphatase PAP2 family protein [Patescibacteria group bacterium]|nr:phosphatase PAP2 family protein [Patescibacteria group bacterium]